MQFSDVVIKSIVKLKRNIAGIAFFGDDEALAARVEELVFNAVPCAKNRPKRLSDMTEAERVKLLEDNFCMEYAGKAYSNASVIEVSDAAVFLNTDNRILFASSYSGECLNDLFLNLKDIEEKTGSLVPYAFSVKNGFLTSSIADAGSGLEARLLLHLPAMTENGAIAETAKQLARHGLELESFHLNGTKEAQGLFMLSSTNGIKWNETETISELRAACEDIVTREREERLGNLSDKITIEDRAQRARAVLKNALLVDYDEFVSLCLDLRYAACCGIVAADIELLDRFMLRLSPANLSLGSGNMLGEREDMLMRVEAVKLVLNNII